MSRSVIVLGAGMVGVGEVGADLSIHKSRPVKGRVGAIPVGGDVQRFAGWVVQVGGEFAFPVSHGLQRFTGFPRRLRLLSCGP